ncbi:MAG TPA: family 10 glycosylhydrolase [Tepidisphaeraceae bacterium]|nr:family 10 glycosylhydrolase [Tepidisphaeraceae bacterium]
MNRPSLLHLFAVFALAVGLTQCSRKGDISTGQAQLGNQKTPPPAQREFRAAWVATVGNIDWPSKRGLSAEEQQREAITMLDKAKEAGLNAIVFQIRTSADALYKSDLEPWSEFLTGEQGKDPGYDPLQFWIDESHKRGLELHAWFNPFRAMYGGGKKEARSKDHIWNTNPQVVKEYGNMLWMDPGEPLAEKRSLDVFMDVVERYDVDGIHIDDYFYPYPVTDPKTKEEVDFPDDPSWKRYQESGGTLSRHDWRRENINRMMKKIYEGTKARKPHVRFGISPFGIWKPGYPQVVQGFSQYDKLYADAKLWLNKGWLDYWTPQLYWKLSAPAQPYEPLLHWWITENTHDRHIWPGLFTSKIGDRPTAWPVHDVLNQVWVTQDTPGASGQVHFSMKAISQNREGIADALRDGPYRDPALVPAATWLDENAPPAPRNVKATRQTDLPLTATTQPSTAPTTSPGRTYTRLELPTGVRLSWAPAKKGEKVWQWTVYSRHGNIWKLHVLPGHTTEVVIRDDPSYGDVKAVAIAAVDRVGNESKRVTAKLPKDANQKKK